MPTDARCLFAAALAAAVLLAGAPAAQASAQPMIETDRQVLAIRGADPAAGDVSMHRVILEGAGLHDWRVVGDEPGRVTLRVATGTHSATVAVPYDADGFQIRYVASADMDYALADGHPVIHPRYNKWVTDLGNAIRRAASNAVPQRRHGRPPAAVEEAGSASAAGP